VRKGGGGVTPRRTSNTFRRGGGGNGTYDSKERRRRKSHLKNKPKTSLEPGVAGPEQGVKERMRGGGGGLKGKRGQMTKVYVNYQPGERISKYTSEGCEAKGREDHQP